MALTGRERLLAAARELLDEGGPRAVTVQGLTSRAGVSAPSLYKHFDGRDALIASLQDEGWRSFGAALAVCLRERGALEQLRACGKAYVRFGMTQPNLYRLLMLSDEADRPSEQSEPELSPGLAFLVARVEACQAEGTLPRSARSFELALALWATCHGLVALFLQGGAGPRFGRTRFLTLAEDAIESITTAR